VHNQLTINKVKRVGFGFLRGGDNFGDFLLCKSGHIVNGFPLVSGIRDAKRKTEVVGLDDGLFEIMPLNHAKLVDGVIAN